MRNMNNIAADMIPIRLIICIAIISVITLLVAFGYISFSLSSSENKVEQECREIESELYSMIASGVARDLGKTNADDGTIRSCDLDLPENLLYIAFGVDPDPLNNGNLKSGLTLNGTVIYYRVDGGNKKVVWLNKDFKFREGVFTSNRWIINGYGQGFIIKGGGRSTIIFELVKKNNEIFILIHGNDNISP